MPLAVLGQAITVSAATLSRVENGTLRRGDIVDGYERVLAMPVGHLRGAIDLLFRTFPRGIADAEPGIEIAGLDTLSDMTEALMAHASGHDGPAVTSGDWLSWARLINQHGGLGLPRSTAARLCAQLVSDMSRSSGAAYAPTYEALARMVCGTYGDWAVAAIEAWLVDPDVQVLYSAVSAACEDFTPQAINLVQRLLLDPREHVQVGAARGIENLAQIDPTGAFWHVVCQEVLNRCAAAPRGSAVRAELSHLVRMIPSAVKRPFGADAVELSPAPSIPQWVKNRTNGHWSLMTTMAECISDELRLNPDDVLPELLFDLLLGPHHTRAVTASVLLNAAPAVVVLAMEHGAELADAHPDPSIRRRVTEGIGSSMAASLAPRIRTWIADGSVERRAWALLAAGAAGQGAPGSEIDDLVSRGGSAARRALYCAGMAQSPELARWREDETLPPEVRGGAAWWLSVGGVRTV